VKRQVIVVGGGASGMAAGIMAARQNAKVILLEHMDRVGKKLLSTGNGRCNLTNLSVNADCYRCSWQEFPMKVLERFDVWTTLAFFEELGILTKNKNGYVYPNSEQAAAVSDLFRLELERLGIEIFTNCHIKQLKRQKGKGFFVQTDTKQFCADAVILATGSMAAPATGSDGSGYEIAKRFGHKLIPPLPALVQLCCEGKHFKQLAGVRCEARVSLFSCGKKLAEDTGEVQLTDYGISGIPTFQVSRFASIALAEQKPITALLDFFPGRSRADAEIFLKQRAFQMPHLKGKDFLTGVLHKKLAAVLLKLAGIPAEQTIGESDAAALHRLAAQIKAFEAKITGTKSFEQAQVCCGGVDTREVCPKTLESRLVPDLYLVGELLDVDGICGGYNLQWAWSTGCLAGIHAGGRNQ
jgi:predicted Rossmann fold flavoprotein